MKRKLLCLSLAFLGLQQLAAQAIVYVQKPKEEIVLPSDFNPVKIFLAGTIDMGKSIDWQAAMSEQFKDRYNGEFLFFNPRRAKGLDGTAEDFDYQVRWELSHLDEADTIVMYIIGSSKSPISLLEMGLFMQSKKMIVVCEPDYYRYDNVRITCDYYGTPCYTSLEQLYTEFDARFANR
ncbi:MAG: nucleoside 2-deoxyribosyltransferase domain-containing protein [Phocaeicola sp.]